VEPAGQLQRFSRQIAPVTPNNASQSTTVFPPQSVIKRTIEKDELFRRAFPIELKYVKNGELNFATKYALGNYYENKRYRRILLFKTRVLMLCI